MKAVQPNWDRWGTWASALCAVHCALTGFAVGLLSIVGLNFVGSPTMEIAFILTAVSLGSIAVYHGARKHHSLIPAGVFVLGLCLVASSHFVFNHDTAIGAICSIMGGLCLIGFHGLNLKFQRGCSCKTCEHKTHPAPEFNAASASPTLDASSG